jgi:hypothetical protein
MRFIGSRFFQKALVCRKTEDLLVTRQQEVFREHPLGALAYGRRSRPVFTTAVFWPGATAAAS